LRLYQLLILKLLLFTDDTVTYRKLPNEFFENLDEFWGENPDILTHSMRIGFNNVFVQDIKTGSRMLYPAIEAVKNNFTAWHYNTGPTSFNTFYPCSADGHIYKAKELFDIVSKARSFNNLRVWESRVLSEMRKLDRMISCYGISNCVNLPVNEFFEKLENSEHFISPEVLNQRYLSGEIVDFEETFRRKIVMSSHIYLNLKFKKED
jgi:hypothetical protein